MKYNNSPAFSRDVMSLTRIFIIMFNINQRAKNSGDEKKNSSDRKERKRREVEERKITLRKDHLDREIKLGNLTTKRNKRAWRDMMMKIKMPILREELEVAWHTFDRSIDIKDYRCELKSSTYLNFSNYYYSSIEIQRPRTSRVSRLNFVICAVTFFFIFHSSE